MRQTERLEAVLGQSLASWMIQNSKTLCEANINTEFYCVLWHTNITRSEEADRQGNLVWDGCRTHTVHEHLYTLDVNKIRPITDVEMEARVELEADKC